MESIQKCTQSQPAANETAQVDLLYRDIFIQMNELNELRPYKEAVEELLNFIECSYSTAELCEVEEILSKHIKAKGPGRATQGQEQESF